MHDAKTANGEDRETLPASKRAAYLVPVGFLLVMGLALPHVRAQTSSVADNHIRGERLFQVHCASCHGVRGEGDRGPSLAVPNLIRAPTDEAFLKIIANGIPGTEMPRSALSDVDAANIIAWVRQLARLPIEKEFGNPVRGRQLYFSKGACAACHFLSGEGGTLGPDLTDIGLRRGAAYLRTALLEPAAQVPKVISAYPYNSRQVGNFLYVRVVTKSGENFSGVRVNEDTFSIQLREASGRIHSFFKSELTALTKDWGWSPMPAYGTIFSEDELLDVVSYLTSMKGKQ